MSQNTIPGAGNITSVDVLASAREPAIVCDPSQVIKEKIEEQIIREINKPIYEFVGAINDKGKFVRYTRLIRRDK